PRQSAVGEQLVVRVALRERLSEPDGRIEQRVWTGVEDGPPSRRVALRGALRVGADLVDVGVDDGGAGLEAVPAVLRDLGRRARASAATAAGEGGRCGSCCVEVAPSSAPSMITAVATRAATLQERLR